MFSLPRATRARQETRATALNAMMSDVHWWTTKTQLEEQSTVSPGYWFRELWLQKSYYNLSHAHPLRLDSGQWSTIVTWSSMYFNFVTRITTLVTQLGQMRANVKFFFYSEARGIKLGLKESSGLLKSRFLRTRKKRRIPQITSQYLIAGA